MVVSMAQRLPTDPFQMRQKDCPDQTRPQLNFNVAAIVVSWHTGERLFACVKSLLEADDIAEVIIVDNGNPPDVQDWLAAQADRNATLTILTGHGNVGFGAGCNLGAQAAQSSFVLFLNPDAAIEPGLAHTLVETGRIAQRPWIVGARIVGLDGREQRGGRRGSMTLWSVIVEFTGLKLLGRFHPAFQSVHQERDALASGPHSVGAVSGACMMMRREDFVSIGGFDEAYFIHVEDIDICRRAHEAGGDVVFVPAASVIHEGGTSPASALKVGWHKGRGFSRYFRKFAANPVERLAVIVLTPCIIGAALAHGLVKSVFARSGKGT